MARTRSTRKPAARSTSRKTSARSSSTRGRAAAKKTSTSSGGAAKKTTAGSRGAAKKSSGGGQGGDAEFRGEVDQLVEKLASARRPWSLRRARQEFERSYVNHIIRRSDMDRQRAAKRLDIGFSTLKEKIRTPGKR